MSLLITVCTQQMRWFGRMGSFLRRIGEPSSKTKLTHILQFVCLSLCIPCFKLSDMFFQAAYLLQQRRLIVAARNRALLCGQDFLVHLPDSVLDLDAKAKIEQRLADLKGRLERLQSNRD